MDYALAYNLNRMARTGVGGLGGSDLRAQVISALFGAGEQGVLIDPSDTSTLFQDDAGTTPVTADSQTVGKVLDLSGNGNHLTQATAAARPLYRTDGTLHWLEFDGVDDKLNSSSFTADLTQIGLAAAAGAFGATDTTFYWAYDGVNFVSYVRRATALIFDGTDRRGSNAPWLSDGEKAVIVASASGGLVSFYKDGTTHAPDDTYANTSTATGPLVMSDGLVYGGAFRGKSFTSSERQIVEKWLASKSGVTL